MQAERREYLRKVGPLLLAAAVACTAAAFALTNTLAEPAFELLLHVMILVAVGTSLVLGMRGWSGTMIGVVIIAIAIAGVSQQLAHIPALAVMYPPEALADEDLTWATLWAWLMVGFCFMLARRQNVLFAVVAGLAIFGLVGTVNLNTAVLLGFAVFVFAVVFIWGYEHLLNVGEGIPHDGRRPGDWMKIARTQALASTLLVGVLLVVGLAVGTALYLVGPRLFVGPGGMMRYARWMQVSLLSYGGNLNTFPVGTGPANLPAVPALKIEADYPALWRGAVFDEYTGSGWRRQFTQTEDLEARADGWFILPGTEKPAGTVNHQRVTVLNMEARVFYAATQPVRLRVTEESYAATRLRYRPQVDRYGVPGASYQLVRGAQYEIVSVMPTTDAKVLRATPADYPPEIVEHYVEQMQVQAEANLAPLVAEITTGATTPYDKAQAIREFLGDHCLYTTSAPALPRGEDAASFFVTERRRGACDLFATSLAVMCRLAGVPARVATGFQVGEWDLEERAFIPQQRDAHAWAEIYFTGVGWVPFDVSAEEAERERDLFATRGWQRRVMRIAAQIWRGLLIIAAVAALLSAALGPGVLIRWLRSRARPRNNRERLGAIFEWFRRRVARLAGLRPERWRTPDELRAALAAVGVGAGPKAGALLDEFTQRFYDYRYGRDEPSDAEVRALRAQARRLLNVLRRDRRARRGRRRRSR